MTELKKEKIQNECCASQCEADVPRSASADKASARASASRATELEAPASEAVAAVEAGVVAAAAHDASDGVDIAGADANCSPLDDVPLLAPLARSCELALKSTCIDVRGAVAAGGVRTFAPFFASTRVNAAMRSLAAVTFNSPDASNAD